MSYINARNWENKQDFVTSVCFIGPLPSPATRQPGFTIQNEKETCFCFFINCRLVRYKTAWSFVFMTQIHVFFFLRTKRNFGMNMLTLEKLTKSTFTSEWFFLLEPQSKKTNLLFSGGLKFRQSVSRRPAFHQYINQNFARQKSYVQISNGSSFCSN